MTLTRLLGINRRLIRHEDDRGLRLAEEMWKSQGAPSECSALADTIETILQRCAEEGVVYPPFLLKRKKQLERGAWVPEQKSRSPESDSLPSEGDSKCSKCGGSGLVLIDGGRHATMCECNKWVRSQTVQ
jgi:hypothetical protein